MSDISKSLNSEAISQQGLLNALELEIGRLKKLNCFRVDFMVSGNPVYFDSQKELVLFRIAQEALNNIIKHAEAQRIFMEVQFGSTEIRLIIQDNGRGFCYSAHQNGLQKNMRAGLTNMQIRSSLIAGHTQIKSALGKGTTVIITAPLETG